MKRWPQIVHTWMFGDTPFREIVSLLNEAGADGVDLAMHLDGKYSWEDLLRAAPAYNQMLGDAGLCVPAATPLYFEAETELCSPDPAVRARGVAFTRGCVDTALAYGCHKVLLSPSWVSVSQRLSEPYEAHMRYAAESVRAVAEYAKPLGVELLIEPINRYRVALIHTVGEALALIRLTDMDNLHIAADVYHMHMEERAGVVGALHEAGKALKCLHIGDNTRNCPGYGAMDWYAILAALRDMGFSGPLSYEPVALYFSEKRVAAEPAFARDFTEKLKNGIAYLNHIMEVL